MAATLKSLDAFLDDLNMTQIDWTGYQGDKTLNGLGASNGALGSGSGKVDRAGDQLATNSKTNQHIMEKLASSDPDLPGSIASLRKASDAAEDAYRHDVVVAGTTPTYVWVFPYGTISSIVVAGVYGHRAIEQLEKGDKANMALKSAQNELQRAVTPTRPMTLPRAPFRTACAIPRRRSPTRPRSATAGTSSRMGTKEKPTEVGLTGLSAIRFQFHGEYVS